LRIATYPLDRYATRSTTIVQYVGDDLRSSNYWTLNRAWSLNMISMVVDDIVSVFNDVRNNARRLKGGRFMMISSQKSIGLRHGNEFNCISRVM